MESAATIVFCVGALVMFAFIADHQTSRPKPKPPKPACNACEDLKPEVVEPKAELPRAIVHRGDS